jgi:hypothetical protein
MIDRSEILSRSQVQFITVLFGGAQLYCAVTSHGKLHEFGAENQFPELNQRFLSFSQ